MTSWSRSAVPRRNTEKEKTREYLKQFIADVVGGSITVSRDAEMMINARIAQLDELVSLQLNEVLHHVEFQRLEAAWRGLHFLLRRVRKFGNVKVRVLNVSQKEIFRQFQRYATRLRRRSPAKSSTAQPGRPAPLLLVCSSALSKWGARQTT